MDAELRTAIDRAFMGMTATTVIVTREKIFAALDRKLHDEAVTVPDQAPASEPKGPHVDHGLRVSVAGRCGC